MKIKKTNSSLCLLCLCLLCHRRTIKLVWSFKIGKLIQVSPPKITKSFMVAPLLIINSKKSASMNRDFLEIKLYAHYLLCLPEPERLDTKQFSCIEFFNGLCLFLLKVTYHNVLTTYEFQFHSWGISIF